MEVPLKEIEKFGAKDLYQKVRSLEVLHFLRYDPKEFAAICRVEFANDQLESKICFRAKK